MNSLPDCIISEEIFPLLTPTFREYLRLYHTCRKFRSALSERMRPRLDVVMGQKRVNFWNLVMRDAIDGGFDDLMYFSVQRGAEDWTLGLSCAASRGNRDLIDYFAGWGGCPNRALAHANDRDIAAYLVASGANDWHWGLESAIVGENTDLVDFFLGIGGPFWDTIELGARLAARHGNLKLVKYFVERRGTKLMFQPLFWAKKYKHWDVVEYLEDEPVRAKRKRDPTGASSCRGSRGNQTSCTTRTGETRGCRASAAARPRG